jgi:isopenicillin-N N-acyltransferase-like protein
MSQHKFPHIRVKGSPYERGEQYGRMAAPLIQRNIAAYAAYFDFITGWTWDQAVGQAKQYEAVIGDYRPHFLDELRGIAAGTRAAGFEIRYEDILAVNLRTEIRNTAIARMTPQECTAFVVLPTRTVQGHTLIGQNWDWVTAVSETVVVLEVEPQDGPNFLTVVEAGLLAKAGMNSAGIGLTTNAMHCDLEVDAAIGVPYHAILRAILEAETFSEAISAVTSHPRGSSANYLVAHRDGVAFNVETAPGDFSRAYIDFFDSEVYAHTNHYLSKEIDFKDLSPWYGPGSLVRHHRMDKFLKTHQGDFSLSDLQDALKDHFNYPEGICTHPNPKNPEIDQFMTVTSIIMDLTERKLHLAAGNPCQAPYREIDYSHFLG